jgi:hypothetical protein
MLCLRSASLSPLKMAQHSRCFPSDLANVESDRADVSHALLCYSIKRDVRASEQMYQCNLLASSTSSASDCFRTVPMFATIDWARCGNLPTAGAQSGHAVMLRFRQSARYTMCLPWTRLCRVPAWTRQRYLRRAGQAGQAGGGRRVQFVSLPNLRFLSNQMLIRHNALETTAEIIMKHCSDAARLPYYPAVRCAACCQSMQGGRTISCWPPEQAALRRAPRPLAS